MTDYKTMKQEGVTAGCGYWFKTKLRRAAKLNSSHVNTRAKYKK